MSASKWGAKGFRSEFPALGRRFGGRRLVYLDNACSLLKSSSAAEAANRLLMECGSCGGKRSVHFLAQETESAYREARSRVARFLNAPSPENIVFCRGTTDAVNLVALSFPFSQARREVVVTGLEHNSAFLPFHRLARNGVIKLKVAPLLNGRIDLSALEKIVSAKTALVVSTRASNVMGGITPASDIVSIARRRGALTLFDSAQYVPSHREDVSALGCSMLAFSGHKIGAQYATGALYLSDEAMSMLTSARVGGGTVKSIRKDGDGWSVSYAGGYSSFEAGVQDYSGAVSLSAACRLLGDNIGYDLIRARIRELVGYAVDKLAGMAGASVIGERENLMDGSLVSLRPAVRKFSLPDFNIFLNHGFNGGAIAVRAGEHCAHVTLEEAGLPPLLRVSLWAYNTRADIDAFCDAWNAYAERLK